MGADLIIMNFRTPARIDRSTVLTEDEFRAKAAEIVKNLPLETFDQWIEDFHYNLFDDIPEESEMPEDPEERAEIEAEARTAIVDYLASDYTELRDAVLGGGHRFVDWTNIGNVSVWYTGGTSFGDEPFEGWDALRAAVCLPEYLPELGSLVPWLLPAEGNFEKYEDTEVPQATGLVTRYTRSILVHTALTHPDADVRAEVVADEHLHFTADELSQLAADESEKVREAASKRLVNLTAK